MRIHFEFLAYDRNLNDDLVICSKTNLMQLNTSLVNHLPVRPILCTIPSLIDIFLAGPRTSTFVIGNDSQSASPFNMLEDKKLEGRYTKHILMSRRSTKTIIAHNSPSILAPLKVPPSVSSKVASPELSKLPSPQPGLKGKEKFSSPDTGM